MRTFRLQRRSFTNGWLSTAIAACIAFCTGCGFRPLETSYGKREQPASVNGTSLLASLFQQAGNSVGTWRRLSPKLDSCTTIVWAPDDHAAPSLVTREYLEGWLEDGTGRTVIYVGRDFDPLPNYWGRQIASAPAAQRTDLERRHAQALLDLQEERQSLLPTTYTRWFVQKTEPQQRAVRNISGPWAEDIDTQAVDLSIGTRLEIPTVQDIPPQSPVASAGPTRAQVRKLPRFLRRFLEEPRVERRDLPDSGTVLLAADQSPFVTRITDDDWDGGKLLVVTNGSFLLNMPLVNREHRKLAQKLVDECQQPGRVIFLESDSRGLSAHEQDSDSGATTKMELFQVWPVNVILIHFLALGVIFCTVVFPIFGRPKLLSAKSPTDFGDHITALGALLQKTGDETFARNRLAHYQQHVRRGPDAH